MPPPSRAPATGAIRRRKGVPGDRVRPQVTTQRRSAAAAGGLGRAVAAGSQFSAFRWCRPAAHHAAAHVGPVAFGARLPPGLRGGAPVAVALAPRGGPAAAVAVQRRPDLGVAPHRTAEVHVARARGVAGGGAGAGADPRAHQRADRAAQRADGRARGRAGRGASRSGRGGPGGRARLRNPERLSNVFVAVWATPDGV